MQTIEQRVVLTISRLADLPVEDITLSRKFHRDIFDDSLAKVELVMLIEDEFGIEICDEDAERFETPQNIVDHVLRCQAESGRQL